MALNSEIYAIVGWCRHCIGTGAPDFQLSLTSGILLKSHRFYLMVSLSATWPVLRLFSRSSQVTDKKTSATIRARQAHIYPERHTAGNLGGGRPKVAGNFLHIRDFLLNIRICRQVFHVRKIAETSLIQLGWLSLSLLFYRRIFPIKQFKMPLIITGLVVFCYMLSVFFANMFQWYDNLKLIRVRGSHRLTYGPSKPIRYFWMGPAIGGKCTALDRMFLASGSINVVLNFIILALVSWLSY